MVVVVAVALSSVDLPASVVELSVALLLLATSGCDHVNEMDVLVTWVVCKSMTGPGMLSVPVRQLYGIGQGERDRRR